MQYTGGSLYQGVSLESIVAGLTGATGVEGVILSNQADFNTKNTAIGVKNTSQDNALSALETKAAGLEAGATGLEGRNTALDAALVVVQSREDALLAGLTGASGLENRAVGFNTNITAINANLNGNIQEQINTKVADSIFQSLKTEFETDFANFQTELNQKVVTATQEVLDARQDSDDAVLEKKFCSIEEFAQTFLQTYTVAKPDGTPYKFDGKIQKIEKAPPIFSIIEKKQNGSGWDLKIKLTDYGYNVMSGNLIVKGPTGTVLHTLTKNNFNSTTKLYTLTLANSNSAGTLINGPYTFEYRASTNTAVYSLVLTNDIVSALSTTPLDGSVAWGKWISGSGNNKSLGAISTIDDAIYVAGSSDASTMNDVTGNKQLGTGISDVFIIKYDLNGNVIWGKWTSLGGVIGQIQATSTGLYIIGGNQYGNYLAKISLLNGSQTWVKQFSTYVRLYSIYVNSDGVYIGAQSSQNITDVISGKTTANTISDLFIAKFSLNGIINWSKWITANTYNSGYIYGISVNSDGLYITGLTNETILGISTPKPIPSTARTGFVAKFSVINGAPVWGKWFVGYDGICISTTNNNVYVLMNWGSSSIVYKLNNDGTLVWSNGFSAQVWNFSLTSDAVYVAGRIIGNGTTISDQVSVTKLSISNGQIEWSKTYGGPADDIASNIAATAEGIYVVGASNNFNNMNMINSVFPGITGVKPSMVADPFILKLV